MTQRSESQAHVAKTRASTRQVSTNDVLLLRRRRRAQSTFGRKSLREIAEILAHVAINTFTNYFNKAAETAIDFPRVEAMRKTA